MIRIGGFEKLTLSDYPGFPARILFTRGCNFRCPYCHNPDLLPAQGQEQNDTDALITFLESTLHHVDHLVITGGEPLFQPDVIPFLQRLKNRGFTLKLDTNGSYPHRLAQLLDGWVDFIAMDIKGPFSRYAVYTGGTDAADTVRQSLDLICESGLPYELRWTAVPGLHSERDVEEMAGMLQPAGKLTLQTLSGFRTLDPSLSGTQPYSGDVLQRWKSRFQAKGIACTVRT